MITTSKQTSLKHRIRPYLIALLVLAGAVNAAAVDIDGTIGQGEYANQSSLADGDFLLYWAVEGDSVSFGIEARTQGWVCLGIDPTQVMAESDMMSLSAMGCGATGSSFAIAC